MMSTEPLILIVDDRDDDRLLLERMLRELSVSNPILDFDNGESTIDYLAGQGLFEDRQEHPMPAVIFLDLKMPGMSGLDVLQWVQSNPLLNECLIIVVSEFNSAVDIHRAYLLGATSFLSKPLNEAEMRECLQNWPTPWVFDAPEFVQANESLIPL